MRAVLNEVSSIEFIIFPCSWLMAPSSSHSPLQPLSFFPRSDLAHTVASDCSPSSLSAPLSHPPHCNHSGTSQMSFSSLNLGSLCLAVPGPGSSEQHIIIPLFPHSPASPTSCPLHTPRSTLTRDPMAVPSCLQFPEHTYLVRPSLPTHPDNDNSCFCVPSHHLCQAWPSKLPAILHLLTLPVCLWSACGPHEQCPLRPGPGSPSLGPTLPQRTPLSRSSVPGTTGEHTTWPGRRARGMRSMARSQPLGWDSYLCALQCRTGLARRDGGVD